MENTNRTMNDVPDSVKSIKKAFAYGCTIAAFMLPIAAVWAIFRSPS